MRSINAAGILACALMIFGLTMYVSPLTLPSIAPVMASTRAISLVANYPNWNTTNPTITVTKGDTITINLSSGDGGTHKLLIDFDRDYVGGSDCTTMLDQCSASISPSTPNQLGPFTVTANAGQYKYYCTFHYPYMQDSSWFRIPLGRTIKSPPTRPVSQYSKVQTSTAPYRSQASTISLERSLY